VSLRGLWSRVWHLGRPRKPRPQNPDPNMTTLDPFDNTPPAPAKLPPARFVPAYTVKVAVPDNQSLPIAGAPVTRDGVDCALGEFYLLKGQTAQSENGVFLVASAFHAKAVATGLVVAKVQAGTSAGKEYLVDQDSGLVSEITPVVKTTTRTAAFDNTAPGQHA